MCEKLSYEQKVNIVKEMSSCYSSDEEIEVEICNTNKMNNIMKTKLTLFGVFSRLCDYHSSNPYIPFSYGI